VSNFNLRGRRPDPPVRVSRRWVTVLHLILALAGWVLFGWLWIQVFYRTPPGDGAIGVLVVAVLLVVSVSLTVAWIRHNLLLADRYRGRRTAVREAAVDWSRDRLGRPVQAPSWDLLQQARHVEIGIDPGTGDKTYRAF